MKIYFNFEKDFIDRGGDVNLLYEGDSGYIMREIKRFVQGRLMVYNDEINEYPDGFILLGINPPQIIYHFPFEFGKKLSKCLTEEDYNYIATKIFLDLNRQ